MMIKQLAVFAILYIFSHGLVASEMNSVQSQTHSVLNDITQWKAQDLKELLTSRIQDNQNLMDLIKKNKRLLGKTEIDKEYTAFINSLLEDQKALLIITDHLSTIDQNKRLHLDIYLARKPALRDKIVRILSNNLRSQSSQRIVNQVLYHTLMEKYATR